MHIDLSSHPMLKRYLTLLYGITLGLALILALLAGLQHPSVTSASLPETQPAQSPSTPAPTQGVQTQAGITSTITPIILPTPNEKTPSALGVTAAVLNGEKVTIWHPYTGTAGIVLENILSEFNRSNVWGITTQAQAFEGFGTLDEAVEAALGSQSLPDVIMDYGYQARHWDLNNSLADLVPYVGDSRWGIPSEEQADFLPAFWAEDQIKDATSNNIKRLGIPFSRSAYVLLYNRSWAKELGYFAAPASPKDFRDQACAAANAITQGGDKAEAGKGGWLVTQQPGSFLGWIRAFGGGITSTSGSGYQFNTSETRQALVYIKNLQTSGCAWSDEGADPFTELAKRRALFVTASLSDLPAVRQAFSLAKSGDEWMVIAFPSNSQQAVDTYGPSLLLTRSTPAQQLAGWLVIQWLVSPAKQAQWSVASGMYPARQSSLEEMKAKTANPQWDQALKLLPDARSEPTLISWRVMRWAFNDGMTALFDMKFPAEQVPALLEKLDGLAADIANQVR